MILGIGSDLCRIERIRRSISRFGRAWLDEVFANAEQQQFGPEPHSAEQVTIGFALKEAAAKAIGTGFAAGVDRREFIIVHNLIGPCVYLSGKAACRAAQLGSSHTSTRIHAAVRNANGWVLAVCFFTSGDASTPELSANFLAPSLCGGCVVPAATTPQALHG